MRDKFKSKVVEISYGKALIAAEDLNAGAAVEQFEGPVIKYSEVPERMVCHAIFVGDKPSEDKWVVSKTNAIFANHSCSPNCMVDDDLKIKTIKPVKKGEELTFNYNLIDEEDNASDFFWDKRWDFKCKCGSKNCQGIIDRYRKASR